MADFKTPNNPVYMYILMRTDLASLNAGKAMAQATHAANQCVHEIRNLPESSNKRIGLEPVLAQWENETQSGFGTCIVLGVKEREMRETIKRLQDAGHHAGITHDPTYPLKDGETYHFIPLDTCAFAFGYKSELAPFLENFSLMP